MSAVNSPYRYQYETVAVSQTAQVLGGVGATGDYLHRLLITVSTSLTSTVTILDDATSITLLPANAAIGVYSVAVESRSATGAWKVTTGAGASVMAVGIFSA